MTKLILIGADMEVIELIEEAGGYDLIGIIDNKVKKQYNEIPVLGSDHDIQEIIKDHGTVSLLISIDNPHIRKKLYYYYKSMDFNFIRLISPHARISESAQFGEGVIIQHGVNIGPFSHLGICSKINVNANIMHDGELGEFCTIAPNVVTLGYVKVGNNCFIGANATILPRITINDNVIIGAGSLVNKNVNTGLIIAGNPARALKNKESIKPISK